MNPTKTLLTLFIYLLPLSVSAGELDGKGVICKKILTNTNEVPWDINVLKMFRFADDKVYENFFMEIDDEIRLQKLEDEDVSGNPTVRFYRTTFDEIFINSGGSKNTINRNSLLLTEGNGKNFGKDSHRCDVAQTRLEYYEVVFMMQNEFQRQVDEVVSNRQL